MIFILVFIYEYILLIWGVLSILLYSLVFYKIYNKEPVQWRTLHAVMISLFIVFFLIFGVIGIMLDVLSSLPYIKLLIFRYKLKRKPT